MDCTLSQMRVTMLQFPTTCAMTMMKTYLRMTHWRGNVLWLTACFIWQQHRVRCVVPAQVRVASTTAMLLRVS